MFDNSKRDQFVRRLKDAPFGAKGFFETIAAHFERRSDCDVKYTRTNGGDMRLWCRWTSARGADKKRVFATLASQTQNKVVFGRCELLPAELEALGLPGATKPTSETEPLNSDIRLGEDYWRFRVGDFIHILEAARIKMVGA